MAGDTRELAPPRGGSALGFGLAVLIAVVAGGAVHYHDKSAVADALARQSAAEKLAGQWQGAATSCSNGVKQLVKDQAAAVKKQHKRELAAIAAARKAGAKGHDEALEIDSAKVPAGCGEAVKWGNIEAETLGHW